MCSACFSCLTVCPRNAITTGESKKRRFPLFDRSLCFECPLKECIEYCPSGALDLAGKDISPDELFNILKKEIRLCWNTGGGVTFSGGEPLLYPEFLENVAGKLKRFAVNIAIETCGFFDWQRAEKALELCDLIYFDIKTLNDEIHQKFTGKSNRIILANLNRLASINSDKITVSMPVIPNVTDTVEDVESVGKYLLGLGIKRAKLLPYHRLSLGKYESLGMEYPHRDYDGEIGRETIEEMKEKLEEMGIRVGE